MHDNEVGNRLSSTCWRAAQQAQHGDSAVFCECFFAAYFRARAPLIGGEDLESMIEAIKNFTKGQSFCKTYFLLFAGWLVAFVHETGAMASDLAEILGETGVLPRDFSRGGSALCLWRG